MVASHNGHAAIVEALIQAGADVNKADNNGATALMIASEDGHAATVEVLIQAGADVDKAANNGATALMIASGMVMLLPWRSSSRQGLMSTGCQQWRHSSDDC